MAEWDNYDPNAGNANTWNQTTGQTNTDSYGSQNGYDSNPYGNQGGYESDPYGNQNGYDSNPYGDQNGYNTNYNYNMNGMPNNYQPPQQNEPNILGIISLVLGIFGYVGCVVFQDMWGVVLDIAIGIAAIVLGAMGRRKPTGKGMATAGMILGIVLLALYVLFIVLIIVALVLGVSYLNDVFGYYY